MLRRAHRAPRSTTYAAALAPTDAGAIFTPGPIVDESEIFFM
jgi:hypothetical protein